MDCVPVKNYLSEAEYNRAIDRARQANAKPKLVEVVSWGKTRRYAAVKTVVFTDMVKVVEVGSQDLVPGNYDDTSFYPLEKGLAQLQELDG